MQVKEIARAHTGGVNLDQISRQGERRFGFNGLVDDYPMMKNTQQGDMTAYYLLEDDEIIAATVIFPVNLNDTRYYKIQGVWVRGEFRGENLALKMYHSIKHNENCQLMSDHNQTDDGRKLWQKIDTAFNVAVMNVVSGKIVSHDINDAYLDFDGEYGEDTVLVTEQIKSHNKLIIPNLKIKRRL